MSSFIGAAGGPSPHTGDLYGLFSLSLKRRQTVQLLTYLAGVFSNVALQGTEQK